jgi:hypothetical protein
VIGIVLRRSFKWSAKKQSYFSIVGFVIVVVFMASVRLLLPTVHKF